MKGLHYVIAATMALAVAAGLRGFGGALADSQEEYVSKATAKTLHQAPAPGLEGKEVIVKYFKQPPGFVGGRHYHTGPVYVYVVSGVLTVETEDGIKTFKAGDLYPEPVDKAMQAKNMSPDESVELVVFQIGDAGKPMMMKAE